MKIKCIGCGNKEFEVEVHEIETVKVVTFVCPACGEHTAVQYRPGGGLVVAVDNHNKGETKK